MVLQGVVKLCPNLHPPCSVKPPFYLVESQWLKERKEHGIAEADGTQNLNQIQAESDLSNHPSDQHGTRNLEKILYCLLNWRKPLCSHPNCVSLPAGLPWSKLSSPKAQGMVLGTWTCCDEHLKHRKRTTLIHKTVNTFTKNRYKCVYIYIYVHIHIDIYIYMYTQYMCIFIYVCNTC